MEQNNAVEYSWEVMTDQVRQFQQVWMPVWELIIGNPLEIWSLYWQLQVPNTMKALPALYLTRTWTESMTGRAA